VLRGVQEPLSAQDIQSAFDMLGLKIERFASTVPEESGSGFLRQHIHGAEDKLLAERTISVYPGVQKLTLFTREGNDVLAFTFQAGGQHVGLDSIRLEGLSGEWGD
jgi:hypothetical protein